MNNCLIVNICEIDKKNKNMYNNFKQQTKLGLYTPVEIVWIYRGRYINMRIRGGCIFLKDKLFSKNDSIMALIISPKSDKSLEICPEKNCNLAKFISGINNKKKSLANQNVYSIRVTVDGCVHIFLIAKKNICQGEILYYDYNAGGNINYKPNNFI